MLWLGLAGQSVGWAGQPNTRAVLPDAAIDPSALCEAAVTTAEAVGRLPVRLLHAISLTESGRVDPLTGHLRAWPWTINAEGQGRFFSSRQDAVTAATALQARGVRSIDVGCLQVNLMYHPDAFVSIAAAFDPQSNARYAARFLNMLHAAAKDWPHAIALYHSDTPVLGEPYLASVMARWGTGDQRTVAATPVAVASRSQYLDFAGDDHVYGAFAPRSRAYGAFVPH